MSLSSGKSCLVRLIDGLFVVALLVVGLISYNIGSTIAQVRSFRSLVYQEEDLSIEDILSKAELDLNYNLRFKNVVMAQILHETDNLRSPIYRNCRNLVGMRYTKSRPYAQGVCRGHAGYASYVDSAKDYVAWQAKYLPWYEANRLGRSVSTVEEYLQFLENQGYAEDLQYSRKVKKWLKLVSLI